MIDTIKYLCNIDSTSGNEENVRKYIISELDGISNIEYKIDALGNIIGEKKGKQLNHHIMIAAHMDEVGMMVTSINSDGTLKFGNVGGIDSQALIGKNVRINSINGVIGSKAVHNMSENEKKSAVSSDMLYIDIGAKDEAEAKQYIQLGDCAYFDSNCHDFGDNMLIGKAIDDRVGCGILLELIKRSEFNFSFAFTVQEEVGTRGAGPAAFSINPDVAIVLEATTAADIPSACGADRVCLVNNGAVIAFMDRSTIYDKKLYQLALTLSEKYGIKYQVKSRIAGGNDCGIIHKTAQGIKCIAISIPCRYLHSPVCVASKDDIKSVYALAEVMLTSMQKGVS